MKILLTVAYDGTNYAGWQEQTNAVAVQTVLDKSIFALFHKDVNLYGASRTDSGVHAIGQRAMIEVDTWERPMYWLVGAINARLPQDIRVHHAELVPDDFHPIALAKRKIYEYKLDNNYFHNPLQRNFCAHAKDKLDYDLMKTACAYFVGTHDFRAFHSAGGNAKSTERTIYSCDMTWENAIINFRICGNGFLYNMVRIIFGTIFEVGLGKIKCEDIPDIFLSMDRQRAGHTMPAKGLTLIEIIY